MKLIIYKTVILFFAVSLMGCSHSKSDYDIYLLIGQSNMAGRAPFDDQFTDTLKGVFLFTDSLDCKWEKAANPFNKYSSIRKDISKQKMGPGYSFAREMAKNNTDKNIGLVVNAKGGTKIELWLPGTHFYKEAVRRTKEAMQYGTLKGIVWHQGEANASKYMAYTPKIKELIDSLRVDFNRPDLPFVVGQLSKDKKHRIPFNKMLLDLPGKIENVGVATSENTTTIDSTHFDARSQELLGERYATEMLKLIKK
jgi:hypothetical protein